jgi:hypothetical protein
VDGHERVEARAPSAVDQYVLVIEWLRVAVDAVRCRRGKRGHFVGEVGPGVVVPGAGPVPGVALFDELPADGPLASAPEEVDCPELVGLLCVVDVGLLGG